MKRCGELSDIHASAKAIEKIGSNSISKEFIEDGRAGGVLRRLLAIPNVDGAGFNALAVRILGDGCSDAVKRQAVEAVSRGRGPFRAVVAGLLK
jgi:hypothetical protein